MKTFEELFGEIVNSDELKKAYEEAAKSGKDAVEAFVKSHDCDATVEDILKFFKKQTGEELTEEEMKAVAGGVVGDCCFEPYSSGIFPWECNPKYSSILDENGNIDFSRICA